MTAEAILPRALARRAPQSLCWRFVNARRTRL